MKYFNHLLFTGILIGLVQFANAQDIVTDRPDQTESSSTVPKGSLQIETGFLLGFTEGNVSIGDERQILAPSNLFRLGLADGFELRVVSQIESLKSGTNKVRLGISDLEVGFKVQILKKENVNTEIAYLSHLIIPTGSILLTGDSFGTVNKLSIAHDINEQMSIGYNIGYNHFGTGKGDLTYSVALGVGVTDQLGVYIEPYGDLAEFETFVANADAGITYLLRPNFQLDFSFGFGITDRMNYVATGFSWNINNAKN